MKKYTFQAVNGSKLFECEASEVEEAAEQFKFKVRRQLGIDPTSVTILIEEVKC